MKLNLFILSHKEFDQSFYDHRYMKILYNHQCKNSLDKFGDKYYSEIYMINELYEHLEKYIDSDTEYIGICHYRRYFNVEYDDLMRLLNDGKIIFPTTINIADDESPNVIKQFNTSHNNNGVMMKKIKNIIKNSYPKYYKTFNKVGKSDKISLYNMFICPINVFNEYCKWIFSIMNEFNNSMKFYEYNDVYKYYLKNINLTYIQDINYQVRLGGFITERLINVFFKNDYNDNIYYIDVKEV